MKTITVKGSGRISVKPDLIVVSMNLESTDVDYEKTMELASEKINELNETLYKVGFEKDSVKTASFNVRTKYENVRDKNGVYKNEFCGYECRHALKVEFDFDTGRLAKVLAVVSGCLAKPEISVAFTVKDPDAVGDELLKAAARDAREKASVLCEASGVTLGELVSIDYNRGEADFRSQTEYAVYGCSRAMKSAVDIDIAPEDIKVNDFASFVWEIK